MSIIYLIYVDRWAYVQVLYVLLVNSIHCIHLSSPYSLYICFFYSIHIRWNVPGAPKEKYGDTYKALEKFFYENHHRVGNILTYYLVPTHIGAVAFHYLFRGHNILKRMNPFAKQALKSTK